MAIKIFCIVSLDRDGGDSDYIYVALESGSYSSWGTPLGLSVSYTAMQYLGMKQPHLHRP